MYRLILILFLHTTLHSAEIKIAVSANVSYAIDSISKAFNQIHPNINVKVVLGSSGKLTVQIKYGAPYDVFMSANMKYPESLHNEGYALSAPKVYAQGALALLTSKAQEKSIGLEDLVHTNIKRVAIANPTTAPYGIATVEALKNIEIYEKIKHKLVYGESISQTVTYTINATDIGIVAKSSLFSPALSMYKEFKNWHTIDAKLYTPIEQGLVLLKHAKENPDAEVFYNFMFSSKAKTILRNFGYTTP